MKKVATGDIWKLGDHILACGSSTDQAFVEKAVQATGAKMNMVLTDPPYGVAYVEGKQDFSKLGSDSAKVIMNDHLQSEEEYATFTAEWLQAITPHLAGYNSIYIFNADGMFCALREGLKTAGVYYSQMLVWVKNSVVVGRKDYLPQHEVIAYGWYGRHKMNRSKAKSVIIHPKPSRARLHPTMKPVGLLRKILPNNTKVGEWIYDPFGGSGSTMIASEHLKRRCLMVEMDPEYCATIIKRWQALTDSNPEKL